MQMNKLWSGCVLGASLALVGCGSTGGMDAGPSGFPQPAGTVAVNFTVDDTANKVFAQGDLVWKGSMIYDVDGGTRKITKDSNWGGPWAPLYDDGPWNAGGHEPAGSTAGDNKWGITVFATPPATGMDTYEYGLVDRKYNDGWIWRASANGTFTVAAGATAAVTATGQTFPAFGTTDLKLVLDKNALAAKPGVDGGAAGTWDTSKVKVKGAGWNWVEIELLDNGMNGDDMANDGKYTFLLSNVVGAGKMFTHSGLGASGDKFEFVYVLGVSGVEYKDSGNKAEKTGVTAFTKASGGSFTAATVGINSKNNTEVAIP